MLAEFQEEEIYWLFKNFADKVEEINNEELARDYAHRVNILLENDCIGDVMSFNEFLEYVANGYFTDNDGFGYFIHDEIGKRLGMVSCDVDWLKKYKLEKSNYIIWYNK